MPVRQLISRMPRLLVVVVVRVLSDALLDGKMAITGLAVTVIKITRRMDIIYVA